MNLSLGRFVHLTAFLMLTMSQGLVVAQPKSTDMKRPLPDGALFFVSVDTQIQGWIDVRVQMDAAWYNENKNALHNGTELRRGRLGIHSRIGKWDAELDIDLADNKVDINDAYLAYHWSQSYVRVGQLKEPFSLERLTSSRYISFLERAMPTLPKALPVGSGLRKTGVAWTGFGRSWHVSGGFFGQDVGDNTTGSDEGYAWTARGVISPLNIPRRTFHLGLSGTYRTPDSNPSGANKARFRARPKTHIHRDRFLNTGSISQVSGLVAIGFESALSWGPIYIHSEYFNTFVRRHTGHRNVHFHGGFAKVSWMLTGEGKKFLPYDGEYMPQNPTRPSGAWELALRYSTLDLNDFDALIFGGESEIVTLGINWHANPYVRLMINSSYVNNDRRADGGSPTGIFIGGDDFTLLQMRAEVRF